MMRVILKATTARLVAMIFVLGSLIMLSGHQAQAAGEKPGGGRPYGGYCRGPGWGWYGAGKAVKTADDARVMLEEYYRGGAVMIGKIAEQAWYFEAEIMDKDNKNVLDRVIVHKKTGRIRSIY